MSAKSHCWHATGLGVSWGTLGGGSDDFQCCFCGRVEAVERKITSKRVRGHGAHHTYQQTEYDLPGGLCSARTVSKHSKRGASE